MKILFLDIDGVLNGHDYDPQAESCTLRRSCIDQLSRILMQTDAHVVISSAWRYMILGGAITLKGFEYLLRTHGLANIQNKIIGITREDVTQAPDERRLQILEWLSSYPEVTHYAILDDIDFNFSGLPFVKTASEIGLTAVEADQVIEILNRRNI